MLLLTLCSLSICWIGSSPLPMRNKCALACWAVESAEARAHGQKGSFFVLALAHGVAHNRRNISSSQLRCGLHFLLCMLCRAQKPKCFRTIRFCVLSFCQTQSSLFEKARLDGKMDP